MKNRQYLTEDIGQIQRYFPGAQAVTLRTPFDLSPPHRRIIGDVFRAKRPIKHWGESLRWTS
ncbi:hypothetical protein IPL85_03820 [Candidatus Saccharibacteria bacterium]|nr:MAG: hypothetical protein IPL85_03820 [Candidatus Saccharibacteria bacterium]